MKQPTPPYQKAKKEYQAPVDFNYSQVQTCSSGTDGAIWYNLWFQQPGIVVCQAV